MEIGHEQRIFPQAIPMLMLIITLLPSVERQSNAGFLLERIKLDSLQKMRNTSC